MDLWKDIDRRSTVLDKAVGELGERGKTLAESERTYRESLAKKILILKAEGYPATLINDLARGDKEVAGLKFSRDVAETSYKAALEGININKIQIKVLEEQLNREWNRSGSR